MKFYAPKYKHLDLGLLRPSLDELDKTNRRVALGDLLPWTELEKEYNSRLDNQKKGAGNKPARMILGAMIIEGYAFTDRHSRDAYNESQDLLLQIQLFKERFGYLPATILADKIYLNRANRDILEDFEVHSYCKPLGRPPKDPPSDEMKFRMAKAIGERNEIECSFGTGKRIYRANDIRAKLPDTARCWTGMCYFVKNVMKFLRELCLALTELWSFFINFVTMRGHICYSLSVAGN